MNPLNLLQGRVPNLQDYLVGVLEVSDCRVYLLEFCHQDLSLTREILEFEHFLLFIAPVTRLVNQPGVLPIHVVVQTLFLGQFVLQVVDNALVL